MKRFMLLPVAVLAVITASAQSTAPTPTIPAEAQKVARSVRPEAIEAHMRYLADDKLEGRKPGTKGFELAAQYVESQFKQLGFRPAGQKGTYRQAVPLRRRRYAKKPVRWRSFRMVKSSP